MSKYKSVIVIGGICFLIIITAFNQPNIKNFALRQYLKPLAYGLRNNIVAAYESWNKTPTFALNVPFHHQQYSLSCEIASLKMALDYYNVNASEDVLIKKLLFDPTPKTEGNIWGDPDKGFVGKIDGKMPTTGYGVYEDPIVEVANNYRPAAKIPNAQLEDIIGEISAGHPVVVWGSVNAGYDISWKTPSGKLIKAVTGEHARVAVGYVGEASNPVAVLLVDPVYGKIQLSQKAFLKDWALLGNKAVVVY